MRYLGCCIATKLTHSAQRTANAADLARPCAVVDSHHPTGRESGGGLPQAFIADTVGVLRQEPGVNFVRRIGICAQPSPDLQVSWYGMHGTEEEQGPQEGRRRERSGVRWLTLALFERVSGRALVLRSTFRALGKRFARTARAVFGDMQQRPRVKIGERIAQSKR